MATPAEITENAKCFGCVPNQLDALLYLFATIAGVTDPATIAANSSCYACVPDKWAALLYLADTIVTNGAATADQVTCGAGAPSAAPSAAPPSGCGVYYDTSNNALYIYVGGAWQLKA